MSRKINVIIIIACIAVIIATALYYGKSSREPFWEDILITLILEQPCTAVVAITESVHLKLRSWKAEFVGVIIAIVILSGIGAMYLLMAFQSTAEVRRELLITLAPNVITTALLYIKMRIEKRKVDNNGIT